MRGLIVNIANFVTDLWTNRLTAARAGYLDFINSRLDTQVSSRADGSAYTTARGAKLDNLDAAITSRATPANITAAFAAGISAVSSVQPVNGTTDGSGGQSINNLTIAAVSAKAIVVSACNHTGRLSAKLTSTTNLRLEFEVGATEPYSFFVVDLK